MLLYYFLKFVCTITLRTFYRTRLVDGAHHIPKSGPAILACNHPNSFLDAILVGCCSPRVVYFLARADVFDAAWKRWVLTRLHVIPIYRLQEGAENLDKNWDTFEKCHAIFNAGGVILIFSEGICVQEMRLRSLKKGTARIALEFSKGGKSLKIVPVGSNYLNPGTFRGELMVGMAPSFDALEFSGQYSDNPGKAIKAFNQRLEAGLRGQVIHIEDRGREAEMSRLIEIRRNEGAKRQDLVALLDRINALRQDDPGKYQSLVQQLAAYHSALKEHQLADSAVNDRSNTSFAYFPSLLIFYIGYILNFPPLFLARWISTTRVKRREFYDSVLVGSLIILCSTYLLLSFLAVVFFLPLLALAILAGFFLSGYTAAVAYDVITMRKLRVARRRIRPERLDQLKEMRNGIVSSPTLSP